MRHFITIAIACVNLTRDMVKITKKHFFSDEVKDALICIVKDTMAADNFDKLCEAAEELEDEMDKLGEVGDQFVEDIDKALKPSD
jgi:carbamoylphosphate synthase large subunit